MKEIKTCMHKEHEGEHTQRRPGSSENAVTMLLQYGAWARIPLVTVLQKNKLDIPLQILFGDDDWINNNVRNDGSIPALLS